MSSCCTINNAGPSVFLKAGGMQVTAALWVSSAFAASAISQQTPPDCCWRQLISLLNSRAGSRGEKLGLLKSVAKSCSFYLSQDFSLDLSVPE